MAWKLQNIPAVAVLAVALLGCLAAHAAKSPYCSQKFELYATPVNTTTYANGKLLTAADVLGGSVGPGVTGILKSVLFDSSKLTRAVGSIEALCTVSDLSLATGLRMYCVNTYTLTGLGDLIVIGANVDLGPAGQATKVAVTGGTGAFDSASGQAKRSFVVPGAVLKLEVELQKPPTKC